MENECPIKAIFFLTDPFCLKKKFMGARTDGQTHDGHNAMTIAC